jgi:cytochrome c peroxidase
VTRRTSTKSSRRRTKPGNFNDLEHLLEQLGSPPLIELGKPTPHDKHLPKSRVGSCPAAHNRALLGEELD